MENKQLKVAIVGGGLSGLYLALCLSKFIPNHESHLQIDIYESTSSLKAQVGAGIGIWPFAWAIVEQLGLQDDIAKLTQSRITEEPIIDLLLLRKADQRQGRDLLKMSTTGGAIVFFHRGELQTLLVEKLPPSVKIHTKKRMLSYVQHDHGVDLEFEDGTTAHANLIIGADGLQSRVRKTMVHELSKKDPSLDAERLANPNWTGVLSYRALIPRQKFVDRLWSDHHALWRWTVFSGKNAAILAYPVSKGANVNFVAFRQWPEHENKPFSHGLLNSLLAQEGFTRPDESEGDAKAIGQDPAVSNEVDPWADNGGGGRSGQGRARWVVRASPEELKHSFVGFETEVQVMLDCIEKPLAWAVHQVAQLPSWVNDKACLVGDAAHAMRPHQGVGAGQGIFDVYVLASLFASAISSDPSNLKSNLPAILETYDAIRRPAAHSVADASRDAAFFYFQHTKDADGSYHLIDSTNRDDITLLKDQLTTGYSYAWDKEAAIRDTERAVNMLQARLKAEN